MDSLASEVLVVLEQAEYPLPGDEIVNRIFSKGLTIQKNVPGAIENLIERRIVKKRPCPDTREHNEYWLSSREKEPDFQWWLSIPTNIGRKEIMSIWEKN